MSRRVPELLELTPYRGRTATVSGPLSTARMDRLREVGAIPADAEVSLTLAAETRGDIELSGRVGSVIELTCQRCLNPVEVSLASTFEFVIIDADQAQPGDEESAEVIVVDDGMLRLGRLVEDELLLALPVVARHENEDGELGCRPTSWQFGPTDEPAPDNENPFAVLQRLKTDRNDDQ